MIIQGQLIYTGGGKQIKKLALNPQKAKSVVIYESPHKVSTMNQITVLNGDLLLFDEKPITKKSVIKILNLKNGNVSQLIEGKMPFYKQSQKKLFYYAGKNKQGALKMTTLDQVNNSVEISSEPPLKKLPNGIQQLLTTPVISVSSGEVIFGGEGNQLLIYNILGSKLNKTPISNCNPLIWREKTKQLLCRDWDTSEVYLTDLENSNKHNMPKLKGIYGVVYIPDYDLIIYGKTRSRFPVGERYDIFSYSFQTNTETVIKENDHIVSGLWTK